MTLDGEAILGHLSEWLSAALPAYLPQQRWFASKSRKIVSVRVRDLMRVPGQAAGRFAVVLVTVSFESGAPELYLVPVSVSAEAPADDNSSSARVIARISASTGPLTLSDALHDSAFRSEWLSMMVAGRILCGREGDVIFRAVSNVDEIFPDIDGIARAGSSRVSTAEQSNSSVIYADESGTDKLVAKVFRRLLPGLNPDFEITRYLTEETEFRAVPLLAGSVEYRPDGADSSGAFTFGVAQQYVTNMGDGWKYMLGLLRRALASPNALSSSAQLAEAQPERQMPPQQAADDAVARLGDRTAELHLALATPTKDPGFSPEPISAADLQGWEHAIRDSSIKMASELAQRANQLPHQYRDLAATVAGRLASPQSLTAGLAPLAQGANKIRVHGDYHLGQVLKTAEDFVIFDFEGEPARPLSERRQKLCVLKDVAGMLRSFDYAVHTVAQQGSGLENAGDEWQRHARELFWRSYRQRLTNNHPTYMLLAASDSQSAAALAAFEFEKAVYELGYELNNRPDWIHIPLLGIARLLGVS